MRKEVFVMNIREMDSKELYMYYASIMKELEHFDTPTVTNALATYPADTENCLGLYEPHKTAWYTDERMRCLYPELGPRCGFAVTCVYGVPGMQFSRLSFGDILEAIEESPKPVILAMKFDAPEEYRRKNAMIGDNMLTCFKQLGVTGVVGDGPARDYRGMQPLNVQCMFTGLTAGHGFMPIEAVNIPVSLCSMDLAPGEVIHMDENGAVKFSAKYLPDVLERCKRISENDAKRQAQIRTCVNAEETANAMKGIYK